jgi:hypothetical protein
MSAARQRIVWLSTRSTIGRREATASFRSVDAALAAGYEQEAECVERQPEGGAAMKRFDRAGFFCLHAWIWEHSPSGLFSDWNPRVKV